MAAKRNVTILNHRRVTIWHTPDFHVHTQGAFWHTVNNHLQFTPSDLFGLVCITPTPGCPGIDKPIQGYVVFKPAALEMSIPIDIEVTRKTLDCKAMTEWCSKTLPWLSIKYAKR